MLKRTHVCTAAMMALAAVPVAAQDNQRVEITGSAIRRVDAEAALPVSIITREEISRSGVVNTEQLLQSIAAVSSMGGTSLTTGAGSSIYGRASPSLRGLGEERTLVLVNGRRVAPAAGGGGSAVNVNTIPLAAIERVEVLRDGASSIYGSDAVAGVINFILRRDYKGAEIAGTYDKPTRSGGGDSGKVSVVGGIGDINKEGWNITLSASIEKEKELKATDREFAKTGNVFPYIVAGATGLGNIEGSIDPVTGVRGPFGNSPGTGFGNPLAASNNCAAIQMFSNPTPSSRGAPYCAYDSSPDVRLVPDRDSKNLSLSGAFRLGGGTELFGDVLYGKSTVTQRIQPSPVRRSFLVPDALFAQQGVVPALILSPSNPNYQTAVTYLTALRNDPATSAAVQAEIDTILGQPLAITSRVFDFGPRTQRDTSEQTRAVAGVRGDVAGQSYEVALSRNESKTSGSVIAGYFSQVAFANAVNASTDWNPWSLSQSGAFQSSIAGAEYRGPTLEAKSSSDVIDGKVSGDVVRLPGGMSQYAVGMQYRNEKYINSPSPALETGDIAGLGGATPPVNRGRKIGAGYVEFNAPIVKGLEATIAVRGDKYNDVGNAATYKTSVRWQPIKSVLLRASHGSGFRAPTLEDLWRPQTLGTSEQFNDPATGQTSLQVNSLSGGSPTLKPEKSKQSSVGIVLQPTEAFSVGLDFFWVRIRDIINDPSAQEVVSGFRSGDPTYANSVTLAPGTNDIDSIVVTTVNSGDAKVSGVDLDLNYRMNVGPGKLDLGWSGTYMSKFDEVGPGGGISHKVGTIIDADGNPVLGGDDGGVVLRWKHVLAATYSMGPWAFTLAQNYAHGYEAGFRQIDGERNFMGKLITYDMQIGYSGVKNLRLALGVKNLTDKNPPGVYTPVSNQFQAGYDVTQYDARARRVYLTMGYKFF